MARNRYIKTHSNYVIKELHQSTNIGNIYERDFMTISDLNSYAPGSLPSYGLNGFKMVVNDSLNLKKKHHYGNWVKNKSCDTETNYWSMECIGEENSVNTRQSNELKPNLHSILDFACFGSSSKLIETSVKNIIRDFPGELYLTNDKIYINDIAYYIVDNPFNIEMDKTLSTNNAEPSLRIFSSSYKDYIFIDEDENVGIHDFTWDVQTIGSQMKIIDGEIIINTDFCLNEGDVLSTINLGSPMGEEHPNLYLYYVVHNGKKVLLHNGYYPNSRITPNNKIKKMFFNNLSGFEKVLLNKKTNYTVILETPKETEKGNILYKRPYTWPKTKYGEWNIDVESVVFTNYFSSLLSIGEFYDNTCSDNIWRALTHESIINFDWTLTSVDGWGEEELMETPNSERISSFIRVAGRQFDDIKQYIDGIGYINAVTYDECGNKLDGLLIDELDNYGWEVKMPLSSDLSRFSSSVLYPGHVDGYSVYDANNEFYRRLLLNSQAILSAKGTKRSIEMVMSLFGYYSLNFIENSYHEVLRGGKLKNLKWGELTFDEQKELLKYSYDMTEYVYVADGNSPLWKGDEETIKGKMQNVKNTNKLKLNYDFENPDEYQGLPIKEVTVTTGIPIIYEDYETGEQYIHHYIPEYKTYLIPWYDKNSTYDSGIYFESKGGWGLKQTTLGSFNDYQDIVIDSNDDFQVYDETVKYLKFVQTVDDLLSVYYSYPSVNDVYYVYDLTGAQKYDWGYLTKKVDGKLIPEPLKTLSHYFVLKDIENSDVLGVLKDENKMPLLDDNKNVTYDDNGVLVGKFNKVDDNGFPEKKYGWKNVSEEELKRGNSVDAKRIYYIESIIEVNSGNNPHVGYGEYDNGDTYSASFRDVFKGAKENDAFIDTSDLYIPSSKEYGFNIDKQIDNVKCWYFSDTFNTEHSLESILPNGNGGYNAGGYVQPSVGDGSFIRRRERTQDENAVNELFSSRQYKNMEPYNMEGDDASPDDEAAANSIINTKQFYIEFLPDISSPGSMYDFIENSVMHYVKQVIPSTTILKYYVPMRDMDVNCYHRTYLQSVITTK